MQHIGRCFVQRQTLTLPLPSPPGTVSSIRNFSGIGGLANRVKTRLDIAALDQSVEFYFRHGLAVSTQRAYNSAKKWYLQFCEQGSLTPLPVFEHQLCQYVSFLANQGLAHRTIKAYLSAVRHLQIANKYPDPIMNSMPRLEQVMRGVKSQYAKANPGRRQRLPITPQVLRVRRSKECLQS